MAEVSKLCQATNLVDREWGNGEPLEEWHSKGYTSIHVLDFLDGEPWNNLALNYIQALRPSGVRVCCDGCCCDCRTWRVTVWLEEDKKTIKEITQEVEIGLYGAKHGQDLGEQLKEQKRRLERWELLDI